ELKQKSLQELGQAEIIRKSSELQQALNAERAKTAELEQKLKTGGKKMSEELTQWEYKKIDYDTMGSEQELNQLGKEGWELAAPVGGGVGQQTVGGIMKRKKTKSEDYGYSR
uniref:hypothetical protein n=1 Tax=Treponema berlinense TaxID=225004 RepID=UPI003FD841E7